jgi:drug/metabolite transporter (DMT)-like permease
VEGREAPFAPRRPVDATMPVVTPRAWAAFAAVSVLWGMPYLLIKVALDDGLSPGFVAWSRVVIGAAVLVPLAWRRGALRGLGARWRALAAFALLEITIPFPLIAAGETRISSSLAAILIAALPLTMALIAPRVDPTERVDGPRLAGLVVGFAGVMALLGIDVAGRPEELVGAGLVLLATLGYAAGPLIARRRLADVDPLGPVAAALAIASVMLAPAGLLGLPAATPSAVAAGSIALLGVACTAIAFVCFFALIAEAGPSRATVIAYVNPTVAVALGVTLLGERIGAGAVAGLLLILAGSYLSTGGRLPPGLAALVARRRAVRTSP